MMPLHPPDRPLWATLEENVEKSLLADALGFDELWVGEHFSASSEPIPSPLMFFAHLIARTRNLTFGTAVINLPNHHPAVVAAEAAQFDHLSKGRFMMVMPSVPLATGTLQPNTASLALHGVRRSTCARTMPSRKSAARAGSSSGRSRKRLG